MKLKNHKNVNKMSSYQTLNKSREDGLDHSSWKILVQNIL